MSKTLRIEIEWHKDDVQEQRPDLTDEQAGDVLDYMDRKHDPCVGINWETIDAVAEELFPKATTTNIHNL